MATKKKSPQDSTLRNVKAMAKKFNALKTKVSNMAVRIRELEKRLRKLEGQK